MRAAVVIRPGLFVATVFGLLGIAGCGDDKDTAAVAPRAGAQLETVEVGLESAPSETLLDGVVEAVQQATLSAQTAGRVSSVHVDVNDRVTKGTLLLQLRATEQVAGLAQAQAALKSAAARDAQARAQYERIRDMYERKVVARTTYDEAVAARDAAAAGLASAQAGVDSAREGVGYTEVLAPYDGVVTAKHVQPGEAVAPGTPLVSVAALDALRVVAEVPQSLADEVRTQRQANVYVGSERVASSQVTLYPSAEPLSSTFRARVDLPPGTTGLAPGMYAKVGFITGESDRTLLPRSAVIERSELRAVYVVAPDGRVVLRQVRLGRPVGDRIEVIAGVAKGERVAIDPATAGLLARTVAATADE